MTEEQLSLFVKNSDITRKNESKILMSKDFLHKWKSRIVDHQKNIGNQPQLRQIDIFAQSDIFNADAIDPFKLLYHPLEFYGLAEKEESNCLYFLVDLVDPLLLYIGETKQTPKKRWMNHDCQDYIANYLDLHYRYELKTNLKMAFCWDTPTDKNNRQNMELLLIHKWRSPFNKESWKYYGQPFKKID
jgi:hypothetical protein